MSGYVRVWDPFVRVAHWTLVGSVAVAWVSGDVWEGLHETAGNVAAGVVAARILWGFAGTPNARFASFVKGPRAVVGYVRDLVRGRERRYLGHNPAGALMILALMTTVLGLGATGWLGTTDMFWGSEALADLHEGLANVLLALIGLHVAGVLFTSLREGENLVRAMIDGRKHGAKGEVTS